VVVLPAGKSLSESDLEIMKWIDTLYIVFDTELLAQKRVQYCEIPEKLNEMKNEGLLCK
jgi:hypothetical protein